ncbi:MAG TPA: hypothetical protein GXX38_10450 [Clostridia bacterium]|jgi:hypothetical protein|nr:hypothetical protein [Clostridia bacterium]
MNPVNPEAIGVFGLIAAVWCFGLEQLGFGVKGGDHKEISKSLAYIAILFGGVTQLYTALHMYLFNITGNTDTSIYLGTVFGFFGLFWTLVGIFFLKGGDKKQIAHFFGIGFLLVVSFTVKALQLGLVWPLGVTLMIICALLFVLPPAWYGKGEIFTKIAGICNILIGICAIPIFLHAIGL